MSEIKAPTAPTGLRPAVFLAGSIEMGAAEPWQENLVSLLPSRWEILNPRRDNWDTSWVQDPPSPMFREQVEWELAALEHADAVAMYFDPRTKSPISLLEVGLYARSGKMIVCSPPGFWRRGNLVVTCEKYGVSLVETIDELATGLVAMIEQGSVP